MPSMARGSLVDLIREGGLNRRDLVRRATAAGMSAGAAALLASRAGAQDASPQASPVAGASPAMTGAAQPGGRSINREEYHQLIRQRFDLTAPAVTGGRVIYGTSSDIDTLNPHLAFDAFSAWVSFSIYEALIAPNPTNGFPAPGLADYWELSGDGLTYTFHMNPNAAWHDGEPVTADDVLFSFDAALDPASLGGFQSSISRVLASYRAVDDHTFELVAKERLAVFVENTAALVTVLPRHVWQSIPLSEWGSDPVSTGRDPARVIGSGPFSFVEWVAEDHVTLAANPDYWDPAGRPVIDEVIFRVVPEASGRTAALTTAEIDFTRIQYADADALGDESGVNLIAYDDTGWILLNINQDPDETELFVDIPVRQAMMYALDRDLIVGEIYQGYAVRADGTQAPLSIAYAPDRIETIYDYDPDKARLLLEEAGWVDANGDGVREKDGARFSFECMYTENNPAYQQLVPYMQQAWGEVGIEMQPVPLPFQTFYDVLGTGTYQMGLHGRGWGVDGSQGDMFRCDAAPPAGSNEMGYCNERYDELDDLQVAELDVDRRIDLLIEQSNILNNEVAAGVLVFPQSVVAYRETLHNFLPNGYSFLWSMPWWWTEAR